MWYKVLIVFSNRSPCFQNLLEFDGLEIFQFSVIVNDDQFVPKCALIYISTEQDLGYDIVLEQLKSV